jgi:hypothetical protein
MSRYLVQEAPSESKQELPCRTCPRIPPLPPTQLLQTGLIIWRRVKLGRLW